MAWVVENLRIKRRIPERRTPWRSVVNSKGNLNAGKHESIIRAKK
jgi:hypothetical protein